MTTAYIGLGSNLGDRIAYLSEALAALRRKEGIDAVEVSSLYETDPVGYEDQGAFVNAVARIETDLEPERLLEVCGEIEDALERKREVRWGPRTIDLDILLFGQKQVSTESLQVPHPRLKERAFALIPLREVSGGNLRLDGCLIEELLDRLDQSGVRRLDSEEI